MSKVFSGHQPNFLPYMGVFYKMYKSDVFVLDDDVQYSKSGLHNKNAMILGGKRKDIVVPVTYDYGDKINEARVFYESAWDRKMLKSIQCNYRKAPHFEEGYEFLERHLAKEYTFLADLNIGLIKEIADRMGLGCKIIIASKDVPTGLKNNARNVYQCLACGCDTYYSGTGGKAYNDQLMYDANEIKIVYSDYEPIDDNLSVLDYILKNGFEIPSEWK